MNRGVEVDRSGSMTARSRVYARVEAQIRRTLNVAQIVVCSGPVSSRVALLVKALRSEIAMACLRLC